MEGEALEEMDKPTYDIDDILQEAQQLKKENSLPQPDVKTLPTQNPLAVKSAQDIPFLFQEDGGETEQEKPEKISWFRRRKLKKEQEDLEAMEDFPVFEHAIGKPAIASRSPVPKPLTPAIPPVEPENFSFSDNRRDLEAHQEEDVKIYVPGNAGKDKPFRKPVVVAPNITPEPPMPPRETRPYEEEQKSRTKIIEPVKSTGQTADSLETDQLQLEELVRQEPEPSSIGEKTGEETMNPNEVEERLRQVRQEKIEDFTQQREKNAGFKLAGVDEEENDPQEEADTFEDDVLEDYSNYEETEAVREELNYRKRTGWISLILTGVLEALLIWLAVMSFFSASLPLDAYLYLAIHLFLLGVMMLLNHRMVGGGIANLFRLQADADSAVSIGALAAFLHAAIQYIDLTGFSSGTVPLMTSVAGLGIFLGALGKQMRTLRVFENFRFVSYEGPKYAAHRILDKKTAVEIGRPAVAMGDPEVAYFSRTGFLSKFLEHSYEEDLSDRVMRVYTPCAAVVALLTAVVYGLLGVGNTWLAAVTIFSSVLCAASPVAAVTAINLPLLRTCRKILRRGGMLANWPAAEEFGDLHALAVDALEVFPSESVMLHGIKTFSGTRIDEAILDAASVCIRAGGPLSSVFRRIIENKLDILQEVDTLVYEQEMGLSGWVNGRRVLVGTRRLLENHGVDVPSRDYEKRYTKAGERQLVYLSIAGDLSAMFVISYVADEGIAQALQGLTKRGLTLLVRTCDPNVTEDLICSVYDLDGYYVEVLGASAGRSYEKLVRKPSDEEEAGLASNGRLEGMAVALSHCSRLRTGGILSVVIQVIGGILGLVLSAFLAFYTKEAFPPLYAIAYLAGWALLTWIVPILFRKT